ncbi:hypothetical protein C8R43DRAFT_1242744 [Mycena crocata]|nr:hypothetical protein C8R43DRAFT_1242744 [Mycena crocata]
MGPPLYAPRVYPDDTLVVTDIEDRHTRQAAFEHVLEELYRELSGDWDRYRSKLDDLGYAATSRVASDCLIPLLADILQRFAAELKAHRDWIRAGRLIELPCHSISPDTEAVSLAEAPVVLAKPVPYFEKRELPPVIPATRQGPKIKTRPPITLTKPPTPVPEADDIHIRPPPKPYEVPSNIYAILERIFLPKCKGRVTFRDFKRVLTCKAIGFSFVPGDGCRGHFRPPSDSGLKRITPHE